MRKTDNTEEVVHEARHYRKERDFVLYDPMDGGFLGNGDCVCGFVESARLTAVEANRRMGEWFNLKGRFPAKLKICDFRGIKPA